MDRLVGWVEGWRPVTKGVVGLLLVVSALALHFGRTYPPLREAIWVYPVVGLGVWALAAGCLAAGAYLLGTAVFRARSDGEDNGD